MGCYAMQSGRRFVMFRRNVLLLLSRSKSNPSEQTAYSQTMKMETVFPKSR
jgi:hypothetical protein